MISLNLIREINKSLLSYKMFQITNVQSFAQLGIQPFSAPVRRSRFTDEGGKPFYGEDGDNPFIFYLDFLLLSLSFELYS